MRRIIQAAPSMVELPSGHVVTYYNHKGMRFVNVASITEAIGKDATTMQYFLRSEDAAMYRNLEPVPILEEDSKIVQTGVPLVVAVSYLTHWGVKKNEVALAIIRAAQAEFFETRFALAE